MSTLSVVALPFTKARDFMWGKPPASKAERDLLFKIDWFVLSYVCLNYWINYIDRSNYSNAYLSGMQEALHMTGFEYNTVNTCFTVGYTIGMIPNNIALLKLRPKYWLAFCSFSWAMLTLGMYKVSSYKQLCVLRFFQALFESSTFSGTHFILGNWYKETELTKRSAVFTSSGLIGSIFSGFMQSSIHKNLDGKNGLAGWRWLFLIDFLITLPIIAYGLIFFPDTPENCISFVFSEDEKKLARERLPPKPETKFNWTVFKRVCGKWHWYLFSLLWVVGGENESYISNSLFGLWLKYFGYSVSDRNNLPLGSYAIGIFATFFTSLYVDHTGAKYHWHVAVFIAVSLIIATVLLLAKPVSTHFAYAAYYISGISFAGQSTFFAWANVVCYNDLEERAIILASMNMFSNAVNAWWPLIFYKANSAPKFRKGCWAMLGTAIASTLIAFAIRFLQLRENKQKQFVNMDDIELKPEEEDETSSDHNEKSHSGIVVDQTSLLSDTHK